MNAGQGVPPLPLKFCQMLDSIFVNGIGHENDLDVFRKKFLDLQHKRRTQLQLQSSLQLARMIKQDIQKI